MIAFMGVSSKVFVRLSLKAIVIAGLAMIGSATIAQTMSTGDDTYIKVRLVRAKEIKDASVIVRSVNSSNQPIMVTETRNVMAMTYKYMNGVDTDGGSSIEGGSGGSGGPTGGEENLVEGGGEGPGGGEGGGGSTETLSYWLRIPSSTEASGPTMGFLVQSGVTPQIYDYKGYDYSGSGPYTTPGSAEPGLRVKLTAGQEVTVCYFLRSYVKLPSGNPRVMVTMALYNGMSSYSLTHQEAVYDLVRDDGFGDGAVDSRRGYGQPNREGQFPADPNAELRNINFGDWTFKGGMFVGNMPSSSGDRSGTSRVQLLRSTVANITTPARMMVVTVYQMGSPTNITGSMDIGLFGPPSGADLMIEEDEFTWSNKWNVVPRASIPSGYSYEQDKDPYRKFTVSASDAAGFLSVSLTKVYDVAQTPVGGITPYRTTWSTPIFGGIIYALDDEQTKVDANNTWWRYIADKEFVSTNFQDVIPTSFVDMAPRIWQFLIENVGGHNETVSASVWE